MQRALSELLYIGPLLYSTQEGFQDAKAFCDKVGRGLPPGTFWLHYQPGELAAINQQLHGENSLQTGYTLQRKRLLILDAEAPLPALR